MLACAFDFGDLGSRRHHYCIFAKHGWIFIWTIDQMEMENGNTNTNINAQQLSLPPKQSTPRRIRSNIVNSVEMSESGKMAHVMFLAVHAWTFGWASGAEDVIPTRSFGHIYIITCYLGHWS